AEDLEPGGLRGPRRQAWQRGAIEGVPVRRAGIEPMKKGTAGDTVELDLVARAVRLYCGRSDAAGSELVTAGLQRLGRVDPLHVAADGGVHVAALQPKAAIGPLSRDPFRVAIEKRTIAVRRHQLRLWK